MKTKTKHRLIDIAEFVLIATMVYSGNTGKIGFALGCLLLILMLFTLEIFMWFSESEEKQ